MTTTLIYADVLASMDILPQLRYNEKTLRAPKAIHKSRSLPQVRQRILNDVSAGAQRGFASFGVSGDIYCHNRSFYFSDNIVAGNEDKADQFREIKEDRATDALQAQESEPRSFCDTALSEDRPNKETPEEEKDDDVHQSSEIEGSFLLEISHDATAGSTTGFDHNGLQELPFYVVFEEEDNDITMDSMSLIPLAGETLKEEQSDGAEEKAHTISWKNAIPSIVILDPTGQPAPDSQDASPERGDSGVRKKDDDITLFKWPDPQAPPCTTVIVIDKKEVLVTNEAAQKRRWSSPVPEIPTSAFEFQDRSVASNSASPGTLTTDQNSLPRLRPRSSSSNDISSHRLKDGNQTGPTTIFKDSNQPNSTNAKAQTTKAHSRPSKPDTEDLSAILNLLPQKQCLAMGVKGPCKARISRDNVEQAMSSLRTISEEISHIDEQRLDERLQKMASLLVCKNRHQSQARGIALSWSPMFKNSAEIFTENLPSSTKITAHRIPDTGESDGRRRTRSQATPQSRTSSEPHSAFRFIEVLPIIFLRKLEPWSKADSESPEIGQLMQKALERPLLKTETKDGFVYIYKVYGSFGHIKIGYTTRNVNQRMKEWKNQCGHDPSVEYPQGSDLLVRIPHARRIEALLKIELASYRRRETQCKTCGGVHEEWYETSLGYAIEAARAWSAWMRDLPYEETDGGWTLRSAQKARLESLVQAVSERARVAEEKRLRKPSSSPDRRRPRSSSRRKSEQLTASRQRLSVSPTSRYNLRSRSQPATLNEAGSRSQDPKTRVPPKVMDSWREDRVVTRSQRILLAQRRSQDSVQMI